MFHLRPGSFARFVPFAAAALCASLVPGPAACAQASPSYNAPEVDLAVTYASARANHTDGVNFWLQGGAMDLHARIDGGLGVVAAATGLHANSTSPLAAPLNMVVIAFGPRYTFSTHSERLEVFGQALAGEANGFDSLFTTGSGPLNGGNGTSASANALAFQTGGGVDLRLTPRWSARVLQVDYLRTQFLNGGTNVQNNLRLTAGLVLRIGE